MLRFCDDPSIPLNKDMIWDGRVRYAWKQVFTVNLSLHCFDSGKKPSGFEEEGSGQFSGPIFRPSSTWMEN